jgi:hypothetical protein
MLVDDHTLCKGGFPDPGEQAEALLEICQGEIGEAQGIVATNLKFARPPEARLYWSRVEVLISKQEPTAVVEWLSVSKLKRSAAHE